MKKKIFMMITALLMTAALIMPFMSPADTYAAGRDHCFDYASVIDQSTVSTCNYTAETLKETYGVDVVYVSIKDAGGLSNEEFANNFLKSYSGNAVIFIDNGESSTIYLQSKGTGKTAVSGQEDKILDDYNANSSYSGAIKEYYQTVGNLLKKAGIKPDANSEGSEVDDLIPDERQLPLLNDEADLLTDEEEANISELLEEISARQEMDVVIATVDSFKESSVTAAADDYYDYNGFGQGPGHDGVLLYVCMETRDIWIATTGAGINAFTDYGIDHIIEMITPDMSAGNYEAAFEDYANTADDFITQYKDGAPFDSDTDPDAQLPPWVLAVGSVLLLGLAGFAVGRILVSKERRKLRSVRFATEANSYLKAGSLDIRRNDVKFVRTDISRVYSPQESDSDGGGGSSIHFGSSGTAHGGGGGKF